MYVALGIEALALTVASVIVPRRMFRKALADQKLEINDVPVAAPSASTAKGQPPSACSPIRDRPTTVRFNSTTCLSSSAARSVRRWR